MADSHFCFQFPTFTSTFNFTFTFTLTFGLKFYFCLSLLLLLSHFPFNLNGASTFNVEFTFTFNFTFDFHVYFNSERHLNKIFVRKMLKLTDMLSLFIWLSRPIKSVEMGRVDPLVAAFSHSTQLEKNANQMFHVKIWLNCCMISTFSMVWDSNDKCRFIFICSEKRLR